MLPTCKPIVRVWSNERPINLRSINPPTGETRMEKILIEYALRDLQSKGFRPDTASGRINCSGCKASYTVWHSDSGLGSLDSVRNDPIAEIERYKTFLKWPEYAEKMALELAATGLKYTGVHDETVCVDCGIRKSTWMDGDELASGHTKNCIWIQRPLEDVVQKHEAGCIFASEE